MTKTGAAMTHDKLIKLLQDAYRYITEWGEPDVGECCNWRTAYDKITDEIEEALFQETEIDYVTGYLSGQHRCKCVLVLAESSPKP